MQLGAVPMFVLRFVFGAVALVCSGLLIKSAVQRLIRGAAAMFAGAVALAVAVLLLGSTVWTAVRRWRGSRRSRSQA
jgi:riboflavin transporter FmnP